MMGRWLHLLLLVPVLGLIHTAGSDINVTEAICIYLRLFDANFLQLQGLLLQKQEQVNYM